MKVTTELDVALWLLLIRSKSIIALQVKFMEAAFSNCDTRQCLAS